MTVLKEVPLKSTDETTRRSDESVHFAYVMRIRVHTALFGAEWIVVVDTQMMTCICLAGECKRRSLLFRAGLENGNGVEEQASRRTPARY